MAKIHIPTPDEKPVETTNPIPNQAGEGKNPEGTSQHQSKVPEGHRDVNDVIVTIKDKNSPIVILFGPPACGKTMTLVRLSRYLKDNGFTITPDRSFRDSADEYYEKMCADFPNLINSDYAAGGTPDMNFMLVKVIQNFNTKCQILEAMGELYFDPYNPKKDSPTYLNQIISCPNRKIWVFMLEPDWKSAQDRKNYVDRIKRFAKTIKQPKDKVILLMNKIDKADGLVIKTGVIKPSALIKEVKDSYPGILEPFKNTIPIISWFEPYRCQIIPFQTGDYTKTLNGDLVYIEGDDVYSKRLWNTIKQMIRG